MTATHAAGDAESKRFQPVETSSQMEDFSVSTKRGAEKVDSPDDRSRETVTILMSFGLVLENFKVVVSIYEDTFGEVAVDGGLERGLGVDFATGWDIEDEKKERGSATCQS